VRTAAGVEGFGNPPFAAAVSRIRKIDSGRKGWGTHIFVADECESGGFVTPRFGRQSFGVRRIDLWAAEDGAPTA
jgi:hypothetical protein